METRGTSASRKHHLTAVLLLGEHHIDVVVAKTGWRLLAGVTTHLVSNLVRVYHYISLMLVIFN